LGIENPPYSIGPRLGSSKLLLFDDVILPSILPHSALADNSQCLISTIVSWVVNLIHFSKHFQLHAKMEEGTRICMEIGEPQPDIAGIGVRNLPIDTYKATN
jgi:hypothetical protein